jgi:hypothetical protein
VIGADRCDGGIGGRRRRRRRTRGSAVPVVDRH